MNKEQFWRTVDDVRTSTDPKDQNAILSALGKQLRRLPSKEIMDFHEIFYFYQNVAYRDELWAASAAMGVHCTPAKAAR